MKRILLCGQTLGQFKQLTCNWSAMVNLSISWHLNVVARGSNQHGSWAIYDSCDSLWARVWSIKPCTPLALCLESGFRRPHRLNARQPNRKRRLCIFVILFYWKHLHKRVISRVSPTETIWHARLFGNSSKDVRNELPSRSLGHPPSTRLRHLVYCRRYRLLPQGQIVQEIEPVHHLFLLIYFFHFRIPYFPDHLHSFRFHFPDLLRWYDCTHIVSAFPRYRIWRTLAILGALLEGKPKLHSVMYFITYLCCCASERLVLIVICDICTWTLVQ